jgi:hypothetical protein
MSGLFIFLVSLTLALSHREREEKSVAIFRERVDQKEVKQTQLFQAVSVYKQIQTKKVT